MSDCPEQPEIRQTLFLGCSIQNFKCSLGWNESASTLSARIIRDTCSVDDADEPKIYYDENLNKQFTRDPDPGFKIYGEAANQPPEIGAPCYFRFGDFEFCGILQSWQQADSATDTDIYDVTLSAPTDLLQGVSLILSEYAGPVRGFNIFNVYAFQEHYNGYKAGLFTQFAEDGVLFGTSSSPLKDWTVAQPDGSIDATSGYGGASLTEAGMPWPKVRQALDILTSRVPLIPSNFSEYGRVCYVGAARGGYGLLPFDDVNVKLAGAFSYAKHISHYVLDLTDIPFADVDYRIGGPTSDILSIISQVCQDLVHDYYVELVPVRYGGQILKVIKFRTVSRVNQPPKDIVKQYVEYLNDRGVIASSYGEELRNESSTNFIIGGKKKTIYQVYNGIPYAQQDPDADWLQTNFPNNPYVRDTIVPYFGKDYNGRPYIVHKELTKVGVGPAEEPREIDVIDVDLSYIAQTLPNIGPYLLENPIVTIPVNQIEAATYSFDSWIALLHWNDKQIQRGTHHGNRNVNGLAALLKTYAPQFYGHYGRALTIGNGVGNAETIRDSSATMGGTTLGQQVVKEFGDLYKLFQTMGQTSLSNVMVRVPYVSAKVEDGRIMASDFPCAGAWTEHADILGIPNPGGPIDYFKNEDGSIPSIASFPFVSGINLSQLEGTKYFYVTDEFDNGVVYTTVEPEEEVVFLDPINAISPRIIVSLPDINTVLKGPAEQLEREAAALNIEMAFTGTLVDPDGAANKFSSAKRVVEPSGLAIAFESRENTYGPWKPSNVIEAGPPGRITVTKDESLVPWEYGGYQNMSLVAQQIANASVGGMNVGENGSITVDGIPNIPLGSEIASIEGLGGGFYGGNRHLFENRSPLFKQVTTIQIDPYNLVPTTNSFQYPYINFGIWSNQYGPNITSIDTSFGDDGITTTYQFRTYSPRFGTLSKIKADQLGSRLKQYNKILSRQRMLTAANDLKIRSKTAPGKSTGGGGGGRGAAAANIKAATSEKNSISRNSSTIEDLKDYEAPGSVLIGNIRPFDITGYNYSGNHDNNAFRESGAKKRTLVSLKDIPSAARDLSNSGYDSLAMMSWDGLFRPVSLTGSGGLPRMAVPSISGNIEAGTITSRLLNFLSNPSGTGLAIGQGFSDLAHAHTGIAGHDIDMVARSNYSSYTGTGSGCSFGLPISTNFTSGNLVFDYAEDYRFFALRGPLFIHGWGYDTNGNPVPNQSDIEGSIVSGDFSNTSLVKKFYPNWLRRPDTWPAAPMDLRFDRKRGVWVAGGGAGSTAVKARLYDDLPGYLNNSLKIYVPKLRCLPYTRLESDDGWEIDLTTDYVLAEPASNVQMSLAEAGCCNTASADKIKIKYPLVTQDSRPQLVGSTAAASTLDQNFVVEGTGASSTSTVEVRFTPSVTGQPFIAIPNQDGTWETDPINITNISITYDGVVAVEVTEVDVDSFPLKPVYSYFTYAKGRTVPQIGDTIPIPPVLPNMVDDDDSGPSSLDNITSNKRPRFKLFLDRTVFPVDLTGPVPRLYIDGVEVDEGDVDSWDASDYAELQPPSDLDIGSHYVTYTMVTYSPEGAHATEYESGHSPPLKIIISEDLLSLGRIVAKAESTTKIYPKIRPATPINANQPNTPTSGSNNDVLNIGYNIDDKVWKIGLSSPITATCKANGNFTTSTNPVPIKEVVITNNTPTTPIPVGGVVIENNSEPPVADPSPPTSIDQPDPEVSLEIGDEIDLIWNGTEWEFLRPEVYARDVILQKINGVDVITMIGVCPIQLTYAENKKLQDA